MMQARHTVKLKVNRGCLRMQARGDGWPKWHKELMAAAVSAASIRRQVRPPADLATGVLMLSRRIKAALEVMRRQQARKNSRATDRGWSHSSSSGVLFRQRSLLSGAHSSRRQSWHLVGSEAHSSKEEEMGFCPVFLKNIKWGLVSVGCSTVFLVNTVGLFTRGFHLLMSKS